MEILWYVPWIYCTKRKSSGCLSTCYPDTQWDNISQIISLSNNKRKLQRHYVWIVWYILQMKCFYKCACHQLMIPFCSLGERAAFNGYLVSVFLSNSLMLWFKLFVQLIVHTEIYKRNNKNTLLFIL